jgi:capsid protein
MKKTWLERLLPGPTKKLQQAAAQAVADMAIPVIQKLRAAAPGFYGSWSRSSGGKFPGGMSAPIAGITFNHWQLRQQARDIVHDSPQAGALVYRWADTVVDSGLTVEPEPKFDILGITPEAAEVWASNVREQFALWCNSKNQHRAGLHSFYQIQHLVQVYVERDNDYYVRLFYSPDKGLLNPLQFEVVDTNQIRGDAVTSTLMVGRFSDGIVRGPDGRELAFKIWVQANEENGGYEEIDIPRIGPGGKVNMLHGFAPDYAGQGRGLAPLGATAQEWEMLEDFTIAETQKAINHASINFVTENMQQAPGNPFDQIGVAGAGPSSIIAGAPGSVAGVGGVSMSTQPQVTYTPIEEARFKQPGMGVFGMDVGDKLIPFKTESPSSSFGEFSDALGAILTARHGMPFEPFMMRYNANYSASRAAIIDLYRGALRKRDRLDFDLIGPVFEMWLGCEIAMGKISCPGWQDPRLHAAWVNHRVNGTPMPNIDPNQTAKADQLYLEMGAHTAEDVSRSWNGSSFKSNVQKLNREMDALSEVKIPWTMTGLGNAQAPGGGPDDVTGKTQEQPAKKPAPGSKAPGVKK